MSGFREKRKTATDQSMIAGQDRVPDSHQKQVWLLSINLHDRCINARERRDSTRFPPIEMRSRLVGAGHLRCENRKGSLVIARNHYAFFMSSRI